MTVPREDDAFGRMVYDYHQNPEAGIREIVEREDGYIDVSMGPSAYFAPFAKWSEPERAIIQYARGRVLDVGCGPGRVALYLQERGHDVVGIDNSPFTVEVARARGVKDVRLLGAIDASVETVGPVDTIVMFGNNFGLFANPEQGKEMLDRFYKMTGSDGRILAITRDVLDTDNPDHFAYHEMKRRQGQLPGELRIRIRYRRIKGPWKSYLMVSPEQMREILEGSGWRLEKTIHGEAGIYAALIGKEGGEG